MELSVTPAGDLRLCKARGVSINEVKIGNEPGMQVDQWGEADSVADGVRSNVTLDSDSCRSNFLCMFLPLGGRPSALKKSGKSSRQSLNPKCCKRCPHQRFQLCGSALRTSLFSILSRFIHRACSPIIIGCHPFWNTASALLFNAGTDRI